MRKQGKVFVISGPSGSGKTTLRDAVLKDSALKKKFAKSVSFTTRRSRSGERNGRDYFFITPAEFKRLLKAKKILEWTRYLGYYYATNRDFVTGKLKEGKSIMLCLDFKGAACVKRLFPADTVTIFIKPPSLRALHHRISRRCSRTKKEEVARRLKLARQEIKLAHKFDYCLVNKDLAQAVKELKGIILGKLK